MHGDAAMLSVYGPGVWLGPCAVKMHGRGRQPQPSSQRLLNTALGAACAEEAHLSARVLEMRWHGSHIRALRCALLQHPTRLTDCSS